MQACGWSDCACYWLHILQDRDSFRNITLGKAAAERKIYDEALKQNPLIKDLSQAERTKLADCLVKTQFKDEERIICQGDPADSMYLIVSGKHPFEKY